MRNLEFGDSRGGWAGRGSGWEHSRHDRSVPGAYDRLRIRRSMTKLADCTPVFNLTARPTPSIVHVHAPGFSVTSHVPACQSWVCDVRWGDVPTWLSSIMTGGSLLLGFYILLRERRKNEEEQARKLACWFDLDVSAVVQHPNSLANYVYMVILHNYSTAPILYIHLHGRPLTQRQIREKLNEGEKLDGVIAVLESEGVLDTYFNDDRLLPQWVFLNKSATDPDASDTLNPDQRWTLRYEAPIPPQWYEWALTFADAAGTSWILELPNRKLRRFNPNF